MPAIVTAWAVGEGIIFWRTWKQGRHLPIPGQLLAASFIFVMLAVVAEADRARSLATTLAWGFDIAALMNVLPQVVTGNTNTGPPGSLAGVTGGPGGRTGMSSQKEPT